MPVDEYPPHGVEGRARGLQQLQHRAAGVVEGGPPQAADRHEGREHSDRLLPGDGFGLAQRLTDAHYGLAQGHDDQQAEPDAPAEQRTGHEQGPVRATRRLRLVLTSRMLAECW
nr:hypothetical protein [Actinomyces ruminis]